MEPHRNRNDPIVVDAHLRPFMHYVDAQLRSFMYDVDAQIRSCMYNVDANKQTNKQSTIIPNV